MQQAGDYPAIRSHYIRDGTWPEFIPSYAFPGDVFRILYTTNAIEALNAELRQAVRARGHFPTDEAAIELLFLVWHGGATRRFASWRTTAAPNDGSHWAAAYEDLTNF